MFKDITEKMRRDRIGWRTLTTNELCKLLYADDTVIFGQTPRFVQHLLQYSEKESARYGLKLNTKKCIHISSLNTGTIKFRNGTPIAKAEHAKYLGAWVHRNAASNKEINSRVSETMAVWKRLFLYMRHSKCDTRQKLQVFDTIIRSKLVYGLETIYLTSAQNTRINAFQLKGLRRILHLKTTFIDRNNTNEFVVQKANEALNAGRYHLPPAQQKQVRIFSEYLREKQLTLFGHVLRAPNQDPMRITTFLPNSASLVEGWKRRVGRPKKHWAKEMREIAWKITQNNNIPEHLEDDRHHQDSIIFCSKHLPILTSTATPAQRFI
jgi:hypothetical protein